LSVGQSSAIDISVFLAANLYNLALAVVFLARARGAKRLERRAGFLIVLLGLPLVIAATLNAFERCEWWAAVLPLPAALHCLVELFVDYLVPSDFRYTRWVWPYLALFYLGQWFLVGYNFLANQTYGVITLVTYFLCLAATFYSYRKVKHG
jgi:hypothetical protein